MIITIASFEGGVGKTTTALHLAQFFGKRRGSGKIVLLDGDPNRSALSWYERGQQKASFFVMDGDEEPSDFSHLYRDSPGKPKKGEKALRPALELIIGKSIRQVRRYLNETEDSSKNGTSNQDKQTRSDVRVLNRALVSLQKWADLVEDGASSGSAVTKLRGRLSHIIQDIEAAIAELDAEE